MIKAYPITEQQQVFLCCDVCGEQMTLKTMSVDDSTYTPLYYYTCKCGHECQSRHSYPFVRTMYDKSAGVELTEDEIMRGE